MKDLSRSLQELPAFVPPGGGWQSLALRLDARQRQRRHRRQWAGGCALAASVLLAVVLPRWAPSEAVPAATPPDAVVALMQQSQALEQRLSRLKADAGVWNGALARSAAGLQRDVALLDVQLSDVAFNPDADRRAAEALWQRRVSLLKQLVASHAAPTLVQSTTPTAVLDEDEAEVLEL
ncbi:MAG: hypothetical protein Q8Q73_13885 [Stagnimonas sp.]|nr:hypothetical protein [Stagnimonas sp.]